MERVLYSLAACFALSFAATVPLQAQGVPALLLLDEQERQISFIEFDGSVDLKLEAAPFSMNYKNFTWEIEAHDRYTNQLVESCSFAQVIDLAFEEDGSVKNDEECVNKNESVRFMTACLKFVDKHHMTLHLNVFRPNTIVTVKVIAKATNLTDDVTSNVYELYVNPIYAGGLDFLTNSRSATLQYNTSLTLQAAVSFPDKYYRVNLTHYPQGVTDTLIRWYTTPADPLRPAVEMLSHPENAGQVTFRAINSLAVDTVWVETYDHPTQVHRDSFIIHTDTIHVESIALQVINPKADGKYTVTDTIRLRAIVSPANADYDSVAWTVNPSGWVKLTHDLTDDPARRYVSLSVTQKDNFGDVTVSVVPKGKYVSSKAAALSDRTTLSFPEIPKEPAPKWISALTLSAKVNGSPLSDGATIDPYTYISMTVGLQPTDPTNPTGILILSDLPDAFGSPVGILSAPSFQVFADKPNTLDLRIFAFAIDSLLATNTVSLDDLLASDISPAVRNILDKLPVKDTFSLNINYISVTALSLLNKAGLTESTTPVGGTVELTASVFPPNATFSHLDWSIEPIGDTPPNAVIFESNEVRTTRALKALLPGSVRIKVKAQDIGQTPGLSFEHILHMQGSAPNTVVSGIIIKSTDGETFSVLNKDNSLTLLAHITPPTLSTVTPITWTIFPQDLLTVVRQGQAESVDKPAWIEVKPIAVGAAVSVIATADNGTQAIYTVNIPVPTPSELISLVIRDLEGRTFPRLNENDRITLVAEYTTDTRPSVDILSWEIEDPSVLTFDDGPDFANSYSRTLKALKPGATTRVLARTQGDDPVNAAIQISVGHRLTTAISLTDPAGKITNRFAPTVVGDLLTLTADLSGNPSFIELVWTIDNPDILTFDDDKPFELVRTFKALSEGHTRVRVVNRDGSSKSAFYAFYVKNPPPVTPVLPREEDTPAPPMSLSPFDNSSLAPSVRFHQDCLSLSGLDGAYVRILSLAGAPIDAFPVHGDAFSRTLHLPHGVYILYPSPNASLTPFLFLVN
jgi:hypothetical protein